MAGSGSGAELGHADGPGVGTLAQGEAEPWAVRDPHASVTGFEVLIEQRVEPVEVLNPRLDRVRSGQVAVDLHREMRGDLQLLGLGDRGELEELGDAADAWGIGLDDVGRAGVNQPYVLGDAGQHFTG